MTPTQPPHGDSKSYKTPQKALFFGHQQTEHSLKIQLNLCVSLLNVKSHEAAD